jgi:two-component system cell cycle response regulator
MGNDAASPGPATAPDAGPVAGISRRSRALVLVAVAGAVVSGRALACCLRRTARLERDTEELARLSRTDPLTGLPNRRHLEEHLAGAMSAARRHGQPLSVLFVDIDGFKHVNDELGYEAGDEVLRTVGNRVRASLRAEDLVGRWGGEEFVGILPTTDRDGAVAVAERARSAIAATPVSLAEGDVHVTVSVGCASCAVTPGELIRQAAMALRQAKRAGKNRVVAASSES